MYVLILAAGYGTRLYPLTAKMPKPLVPINGKPMLNFLFDKIALLQKLFAIETVRIVVNNKFYTHFVDWQQRYDMHADLLNDGSNTPEDRLGAVRDMQFGIGKTAGDWLILGGDNLFEDDLTAFIDFALKNRPYPSVGLYDVQTKEQACRCGVVALNQKKRITKFQEKPKDPFSTLAASCVYFFPQEALDLLETFIKQHSHIDAAGTYIEWLVGKTHVFGYVLKGKWVDIGSTESLKIAEQGFHTNEQPSSCG